MFWGREDVYAKRGKNGAYFPQCDNRWDARLCPKQRGEKVFCDECENTKWTWLDVKKIIAHLLGYKEDGTDVIGVYYVEIKNSIWECRSLSPMPRIQNQIRSLAAFDNPKFYKSKRLKLVFIKMNS